MSELKIESITKEYEGRRLLQDVAISCKKGEVVAILGRNGSGKSTLLEIAFGTKRANHRYVKASNKYITKLFGIRKHLNYLPQNSFLPKHVKSKLLLTIFCGRDALKNSIIEPYLGKKSKEMSFGEKRLVEIYMMCSSASNYVLLDEPFSGVAPILRDHIKEIIASKLDQKGFVITDHDYENVLDIANKVYLIHEGTTIEVKGKKELQEYGYLPSN